MTGLSLVIHPRNIILTLITILISTNVNAQEPIDSALYYHDTTGVILNEGDFVNILGEPCIVLRNNRNQDGLVMSMNWRPGTKEKNRHVSAWAHYPTLPMMNSIPRITHPIGLNDTISGLNNLIRLKKLLDNSFFYQMIHYHAFNTCETMGNGWYLPSKGELHLLYKVLGIQPYFDKKECLAKVNEFRTKCGLKKIKSIYLWSSTEGEAKPHGGLLEDELNVWVLTHKKMVPEQKWTNDNYSQDQPTVAPVHLIKAVIKH